MTRVARLASACAAAALLAGCAAQSDDPNRRILRSHNLLRHTGYGGMGPVSTGELGPGESQNHRAVLEAGTCYLVVAFGASGLEDVGVTISGPDGAPIAEARGTGSTGAVSFCAERAGEHQVAVTAAQGSGPYHLAYWFRSEGAPGGAAGPTGGNEVALGRPVTGVLPHGGRVDYTLRLREGRSVSIDLMSDEFDCYLYLLRDGVEIGRDDDGGSGLNSRLTRYLEPGTYTVRVGSFMDSGAGTFSLVAR